MSLSNNAQQIFKTLYSFQGENIDNTFERVAKEFACNDDDFKIGYALQKENLWRPNTPVYLNAGTNHKIFSACFVVGLEDTMDSIYDIANVSRKIFQRGAGVGIPISNLRESEAYIYEGDSGKAPEGQSSGPISFQYLYDAVAETTKSGGRSRRAAIMSSMLVYHPDIMNFIECKEADGRLANMNISVCLTDNFMTALKDGIPYPLITPYDGSQKETMDAADVWNKMVEMSWKTADPGVLFIDTINKFNPLKKHYLIETPNPCGEQPLVPWTCCNLSAINVAKFVDTDNNEKAHFHWENLYNTAYQIMGLMNNIIEKMDYPDPRFKEMSEKFRPVGIGIMGLADAMYMLNIKYDSVVGKSFAADIMKTITTACIEKSADLAKEYGPFYNYKEYKSDVEEIMAYLTDNNEKVMKKVREFGIHNSQHTTCAPTGTTAISCDATYGMEPCFGLVFQKNLINNTTMFFVNSIFERRFKNETWYDDILIEKIFINGGSLKGIHGIPKEVRDIFIVAHDIKIKDRVDIQAELQRHCSTAISSTINLSEDTTPEEISDLYKYAYIKGLKGVTIYRDGSKKSQPITFKKENETFKRPTRLKAETFTLDTGNGKMYVTVSSVGTKPVEVFIQIGKSGQVLNTFSEALGRTISIALQHKVPLTSIIKTLIGINSDKPTWSRLDENDGKPVQILSVPDGLAQLLERYYLNDGKNGSERIGETCPKCNRKSLMNIEGCNTCLNCGYSKCE